MYVNEIRDYLRQQPFKPLRLHLSDQSSYEVRHPEMIMVTRTLVLVATRLGADDVPEQLAYLDPIHITRIEPLNPADAKGNGKSKK